MALLLPALLLAAGLAVYLPAPVEAGARLAQHLLSIFLQVLAATAAAVLLFQTARTYSRRDHERRVWRLAATAALLWTVVPVVRAAGEWFGQRSPYPSAADGFAGGAFVLLLAAVADEFRLVNPMLLVRQRLGLLGVAVILWVAVIGGFMWPLLASPLDPLEKVLDLFYAGMVGLLVPLALGPALAFRGGTSGYVWLGMAAGAAALALAGLGFAYLTFYDLYTDVHPVNLLRIAGLTALAASGAWHRRMIEAV